MKWINAVFITIALQASLARADMPSTHVMILFGKQATYASHLPMFHAPHDYQVIMKVHLSQYPRLPEPVDYYNKSSGLELFTLVPAKMDLTKVISGEIKTFEAILYEGHFEKGGKDLGPVLVTVEKLILSAKLDPQAIEKAPQYLIFGEKGEYFATHIIKGMPSFDAVVKVSKPTTTMFLSCRTRVCADPIVSPIDDSKLPLTLGYQSSEQKPIIGDLIGGHISVSIEKLIHFELDELSH